jgi:hypothetical protein
MVQRWCNKELPLSCGELGHNILEGREEEMNSELVNASPYRYVGAVAISINYSFRMLEVASWKQGDDVVFAQNPESRWPDAQITSPGLFTEWPDPFVVRDAFEAVNSEESIRRFLSLAGPFWPDREIRLSQFREWQAFFKLYRRDDFSQLAEIDPQAKQAENALYDDPHSFFHFEHPGDIERHNRDREIIGATPPSGDRNRQSPFVFGIEERRAKIRDLIVYVEHPTVFVRTDLTDDAIAKIERDDKAAGPNWVRQLPAPTPDETRQVLTYEPSNVIEAIAATISADRLLNIRHRVCEHCGRLFQLTDRQKRNGTYCKHFACKDAARAKRRTKVNRDFRDFYIARRKAGHDPVTIEEMAISNGIKPGVAVTKREMERAEKALARSRQVK